MTKNKFLQLIYKIDPLASKWLSEQWSKITFLRHGENIAYRFSWLISRNYPNPQTILAYIINWGSTPQGESYWNVLYSKLSNGWIYDEE